MARHAPPSEPGDVAAFASRSSFSLKRQADGRVALQATFVYRSLRYEIEGHVDGARPGPMKHRLSSGKGVVWEATVLSGTSRGRVELSFGKATKGVRALVLDVEPLQRGALVSGFADGAELLPVRAGDCGCSLARAAGPLRPAMAWGDQGAPAALRLTLPGALASDGAGLAQVVEATMARQAGGVGLGDVIDILDWAFCYVNCVGELLWCVLTQPDIPGTKDIFDTLCFVVWGACTSICRIKTPF